MKTLIESQWQKYRDMVMPKYLTKEAECHCKIAFYAGAIANINAIKRLSSSAEIPESMRRGLFESLDQELQDFNVHDVLDEYKQMQSAEEVETCH